MAMFNEIYEMQQTTKFVHFIELYNLNPKLFICFS
jgi:hypothetical protein